MTAKNTLPATLQIRQAVKAQLSIFKPADLVLVACSGGADSLALAKAVALEAPIANLSAGAIVVDHSWSETSREIAAMTAKTLEEMQLAPVLTVQLPTHEKNETVARSLRYSALHDAAIKTSARAVFTGHTQDDQAETVLMRLARGSGTTSLSGIPPKRDIFFRPLLGVSRETTQAACAEWSLSFWQDPANEDLRHTRVRVRKIALPALIEALGPSVIQGLVRSADLLRDDAEVLDGVAAQVFALVFDPKNQRVNAEKLSQEQPAISRRVLLTWVRCCGVPRAELSYLHATNLQELLSQESGRMRVALPSGFAAWREGADLICEQVKS